MNTNHVNTQTSRLIFALVFSFCLLALAATIRAKPQAKGAAQATDAQGAPMYRVDAFWPKRLPNRWSMQQVTGLYVDERNDHVWFLNRGAAADGDEIGGGDDPPRIACCVRGPEAIELDPEGNVYTPGADLATFRNGRRHCRPFSWTARETSGSPERRRRTAS